MSGTKDITDKILPAVAKLAQVRTLQFLIISRNVNVT